MIYASYREFLSALREDDAAISVKVATNPLSELTAAAGQIFAKTRKPAVFEKIAGHPKWSVSTDTLSSRSLWARALGLDEAQLLTALSARCTHPGAASYEKFDAESAYGVARKANLHSLPIPQRAELDKLPAASVVVVAQNASTGKTDVAFAQMQVADQEHCVLFDMPMPFIALHKDAACRNERVKIALVFGAHPAVYLAAELARSLPWATYDLAGQLLGETIPLKIVDDIKVPAEAEYLVVGEVIKSRSKPTAISNELGTYSVPQTILKIRCKKIYQRPDAIHPVIERSATSTLATEVLIWKHIQNIEGGLDILDIRCHHSGCGLIAVVKMRPRLQGQAKTALLGTISGIANQIKCAIAVDEDVDASSLYDVMWSLASRTNAGVDIGMAKRLPALEADHCASNVGDSGFRIGTRWFIDSTMPPLSQPEKRAAYQRALPKNLMSVDLKDFV